MPAFFNVLSAHPEAVHVANVLKLCHTLSRQNASGCSGFVAKTVRPTRSGPSGHWSTPALSPATTPAPQAVVAELSDKSSGRVVEYRNSQGTALRAQVVNILIHVALTGPAARPRCVAPPNRCPSLPSLDPPGQRLRRQLNQERSGSQNRCMTSGPSLVAIASVARVPQTLDPGGAIQLRRASSTVPKAFQDAG
jgi:hypothetical protein